MESPPSIPKTMRLIWILMALVTVSAFAVDPPPVPKKVLTLQDAIAFAVAHSPKIDSALKTQETRELEYKSALAKFLPSIDLAGTVGLQNNFTLGNSQSLLLANTTAPWYSSLTLGATETLYDNGVSITQSRIADRNREMAAIEATKARASLTLELANEFYSFSLSQALVEVKAEQLKILEKQFGMLSEQYKQGLKPRLDYLRFKAQVQRAMIDKTTAEKTLEQAEAQLKKIMGVEIQDQKESRSSAEDMRFEPLRVETQLQFQKILSEEAPSLSAFYDSKLAAIQREISDENVYLAVRRYYPQVTVTGSVTYSNLSFLNSPTSFGPNGQLSYTALLGVHFNIWDWGTRKRDITQAELAREMKANEMNLGLIEVRNQIDSLMINVSRIKNTYQMGLELLKSEEENYRNIEIQYREGKVPYLDLITALNNVLGARTQFYSAYFDALQTLAKYYFYQGSIYENLMRST